MQPRGPESILTSCRSLTRIRAFPTLRSRRAALALVIVAAFASGPADPAAAWSPATRKQMVEDAVRLVPPALQRLLKRYRRELARGMTLRIPEQEAGHFEHADGSGDLVETATDTMRAAWVALQTGEPLRQVVTRMGRVAHLVGDLDDPLAMSHEDPREPLYAQDYARYVERILPKVRLTLEHRPPQGIDTDSLRSWSRASADWSRDFYDPIGRSYWVDGRLVESRTFDERSIPFGIGSLTYARAVNDLALAWMTIWREGGGDASGALYDRLIEVRERRAGDPGASPATQP